MNEHKKLSNREEVLADEITKIYNSGDCKTAVEKSIHFLREFPESIIARYKYAVMHGDYSFSVELTEEEKVKYRTIGKNGVKELFEDPSLTTWPSAFQFRVRNEYYWFFELHQEQYDLGIERITLGEPGYYSSCVGASMLAFKSLKEKNVLLSEDWALKSLMHFHKFEEHSPNWYNINHFSALAAACLGKYEESLNLYKDMYRKQRAPINEKEVAEFVAQIEIIKTLRGTN
jgi:hypothetical protein